MNDKFIPNSFQIPNQIIDVFMPRLSEMELKFYLFIMRKTKGWQKDSDGISISQFLQGAKIKDERTVKKAIKGLLKNDLIFQTYRKGTFSIFSINLNPNPLHIDEGSHADAPTTSLCANSLQVDVGTPPSDRCLPHYTTTINIKQSTTTEEKYLEKWLEQKSKGKNTPENYKFSLRKKILENEKSYVLEFLKWREKELNLLKVSEERLFFNSLIGKFVTTTKGKKEITGVERGSLEYIILYFLEGDRAEIPSDKLKFLDITEKVA